MTQAQRKPHKIEAAVVPERYARGWHVIGTPDQFTNKPLTLNYFGTKLVAYRGESGAVVVLDGYCPHMGGDLSEGCVKGDSVICPFHHWSWGSDGVCDDIPYAKRIPAKAVIQSWPTLEKNGLVFVWNDPECNAPIPEQEPRRIDDCYSDDWSEWSVECMTIHTNSRELVDNMADVAHFGPVHGAPIGEFKNIVDGHTYTQVLRGSSENLATGGGELTSTACYEGPAYMTTYMTGEVDGEVVESRLLVSHVPIDTESFDLRFGVKVKKSPKLSAEENAAMVQGYVEANRVSFFQDVHVWHTKCRVDNPVLCDGDGPVHRLRGWYEQFYMDVDQIPASLKERREYVVDYHCRTE